jgi:hypothetical protein
MTPYPVGETARIDLGWYKLIAYLLMFAAVGVRWSFLRWAVPWRCWPPGTCGPVTSPYVPAGAGAERF